MIPWNPLEFDPSRYEVVPSQPEVKIGALRPVVRLQQEHLPRIRLRVISVKRGVHDVVGISRGPSFAIAGQLPGNPLNLATSFVQPVEHVSRSLASILMKQIR